MGSHQLKKQNKKKRPYPKIKIFPHFPHTHYTHAHGSLCFNSSATHRHELELPGEYITVCKTRAEQGAEVEAQALHKSPQQYLHPYTSNNQPAEVRGTVQ